MIVNTSTQDLCVMFCSTTEGVFRNNNALDQNSLFFFLRLISSFEREREYEWRGEGPRERGISRLTAEQGVWCRAQDQDLSQYQETDAHLTESPRCPLPQTRIPNPQYVHGLSGWRKSWRCLHTLLLPVCVCIWGSRAGAGALVYIRFLGLRTCDSREVKDHRFRFPRGEQSGMEGKKKKKKIQYAPFVIVKRNIYLSLRKKNILCNGW